MSLEEVARATSVSVGANQVESPPRVRQLRENLAGDHTIHQHEYLRMA